jgi:PAS domain S-box-containing protein
VIIYTDVTEKLKVERELEAHREHLEEMVYERTKELENTLQLLKEEVEEHRQTAKELRESEVRFRELAHLLPEIVFEIDTDGVIQFVNECAYEMTGYTQEEALGKMPSMNFLIPEDRKRGAESLKLIAQGKESSGNEYTAMRKDGSTFPVISFTTPIVLDGKFAGFRGIIVDISKSKKLEERLRQAAKMEAVGTLAGGIAHDFNNILQGISGYIDLVLQAPEEAQENVRRLGRVQNATTRAIDLVQSLLMFSRRDEPEVKVLDLNSKVLASVDMLERLIPKMIWIERVIPVMADPTQIDQVIINLGTNARDSMPDGGTLTISTFNTAIGSSFASSHPDITEGLYVCLKISDTGEGIAPSTAKHIFDPFFTTKEVGQGTGLGLSTAYGIVKSHNGYLSCESAPGVGTSFNVLLPAQPEAKLLDESPDGSTRLKTTGTEAILFVDDEVVVRELGNQILSKNGFKVDTAESGEAALEMYNEKSYDLVVLDLGMPGMGGMRCLEDLLKINPDVKVVVASGYEREKSSQYVTAAGAKGFLPKPYKLDALLQMVREVLDS